MRINLRLDDEILDEPSFALGDNVTINGYITYTHNFSHCNKLFSPNKTWTVKDIGYKNITLISDGYGISMENYGSGIENYGDGPIIVFKDQFKSIKHLKEIEDEQINQCMVK
jgi:hypothetical protein